MPSSTRDDDLADVVRYYDAGLEEARLGGGHGQLEWERTTEMLARHLPPPPAVIWDVGGGPGRYACWLARSGYQVHLVDPVPLHIEQATRAAAQQAEHPLASASIGDAGRLDCLDGSADAVLLLGPLYHLTDRRDRISALHEARRVLRPGGVLFAVGISRFASLLDGLFRGVIDDPSFAAIIDQDLCDGQHRNPTSDPSYFTTAYFHHPDDLAAEVQAAGFSLEELVGLEGPTWFLQDFDERWNDPSRQKRLLEIARRVAADSTLLGVSAHLMAVARA